MKKLLLAGTALGGLAMAGPAFAADIPVKAPPVVAPAFTWTGCYIGGNVGGGAGQKLWDNFTGAFFEDLFGGPGVVVSTTLTTVITGTTGKALVSGTTTLAQISSISQDTHGFLAGGQVGCDYQFAPRWVIGISGDGEWAHLTGTDDIAFTTTAFSVPNPFGAGNVTVPGAVVPGMFASAHSETRWLAAVTARLGYVPWDRWLFYVKGGAAWAGDRYSLSGNQCFDILLPATCEGGFIPFDFHAKETRFGWTTGLGVEYAFWDGWSGFLEYDHYDFGSTHVNFTDRTGNFDVGDADIKQRIDVIKFGINYRFGFGKGKAPVAVLARY